MLLKSYILFINYFSDLLFLQFNRCYMTIIVFLFKQPNFVL